MQEQEYVTKIQGIEGFIKQHARQFSNGDRMLAEDLQQVARVAAYKHLRESPDCPESHLVVKAKMQSTSTAERGKALTGSFTLQVGRKTTGS